MPTGMMVRMMQGVMQRVMQRLMGRVKMKIWKVGLARLRVKGKALGRLWRKGRSQLLLLRIPACHMMQLPTEPRIQIKLIN